MSTPEVETAEIVASLGFTGTEVKLIGNVAGVIRGLLERIAELERKLETMTQAVGLATTLKPDMEIDANHPVEMMQQVCRRIAELERELAEANKRIAQLEHCSEIETYAAAEQRIAELEKRCKELYDESNWHMRKWQDDRARLMQACPGYEYKNRVDDPEWGKVVTILLKKQ